MMNQNSGTKATIKAGKSSGRYDAGKIKTEDSKKGRYSVELEIEELSRYDLTKKNHELEIETEDGEKRTFTISLDDDEDCKDASKETSTEGSDEIDQCDEDDDDCECVLLDEDDEDKTYCCSTERRCSGDNCCGDECDEGDDDCFCDKRGRNCYEVPKSAQLEAGESTVAAKATKIMVESCLTMSAALLKTYNADGSKRERDDDEDDFEEKLEEFFEDATCTKYDDDIQDYYNGKKKSKASSSSKSQPLQLREGSVSFNSAPIGGKVGAVAAKLASNKAAAEDPIRDAARAAAEVEEQQKRLEKAAAKEAAQGPAKK